MSTDHGGMHEVFSFPKAIGDKEDFLTSILFC
jgi:hypothetical protein